MQLFKIKTYSTKFTNYEAAEVLLSAIVKSAFFLVIMLYISKTYRRFGDTHRLYIQGVRVGDESNQQIRWALILHPEDGGDVFLPICYPPSELNGSYNLDDRILQ